MERYRYTVEVVIEVDAFTQSDADDAVQDAIGLGDACGLNVVEMEIKKRQNVS